MIILIVAALAFKNTNGLIKKKQINGCATISVRQDDPCHFLRVLYGMVANSTS